MKDYSKQSKHYHLEFSHIGEGHYGEYSPDNPDDEKLIRVTVYNKSAVTGGVSDEPIRNSSYCTPLTVDDTNIEYHAHKLLEMCEKYLQVKGIGDLGGLGNHLGDYDFTLPHSIQFIKEA